jgi:hypothetical protein
LHGPSVGAGGPLCFCEPSRHLPSGIPIEDRRQACRGGLAACIRAAAIALFVRGERRLFRFAAP